MNKRLEKRHKRQVARAKQPGRITEPDVRTPEQIKAAKEAGHRPDSRGTGSSGAHLAAAARDSRPKAKHREKVDVSGS
jgi:hypothetical protein